MIQKQLYQNSKIIIDQIKNSNSAILNDLLIISLIR
jgi:hypothetical protein